jgi:hypothetical protein
MAQARGFSCDGPDCKTFEVGSPGGDLPAGWIAVAPVTHSSAPGGVFELCGDRCMKRLAERRLQAAKEATPIKPKPEPKAKTPPIGSIKGKDGRVYTPEGRAAMSRNGRHTMHKIHHVRNPREDCEWCEEETRSSKAGGWG